MPHPEELAALANDARQLATLAALGPPGGALAALFAAPTAKVGAAAIAGVATTAMRSDAAPAFDLAANLTFTGAYTFNGGLSLGGASTRPFVIAGSASAYWTAGAGQEAAIEFGGNGNVGGVSSVLVGQGGDGNAYVYNRAATALIFATSATERINISAAGAVTIRSTIGFNNTTPIAKPTVTGSRAGNAALASLLTALANYGLITDSSTP